MRFRSAAVLAGIVVLGLLLPADAEANAGTPLIWLTAGHLAIGNAFIGVFEGAIAARLLARKWWVMVPAAILANYASAAAGAYLVLRDLLPNGFVPSLWAPFLSFMFLVLLSGLVEWPFLWAAAHMRGPRRTAMATMLAQLSSYAVLVPLFAVVSSGSLYTSTRIRDVSGFAKPPIGEVYFIDGQDRLMKIRTDGTDPSSLPWNGTFASEDGIAAVLSSGGLAWIARIDPAARAGRSSPTRVLELPNVRAAPISPDDRGRWGQNPWRPEVLDLRNTDHAASSWSATCGGWAEEGLTIHDGSPTGHRIALATPMAYWECRDATILPSAQVVARIGPHIVLYDPATRTIGRIATGRSPVVVLPEGPSR